MYISLHIAKHSGITTFVSVIFANSAVLDALYFYSHAGF